jgi:hypothetical protein
MDKAAEQMIVDEKHLPRGELVKASVAGPMIGMTAQFLQRRALRKKSPIPFRYIDGNYLFDTADIEDYLAAAYVPAGE